jgi:phospholipase C
MPAASLAIRLAARTLQPFLKGQAKYVARVLGERPARTSGGRVPLPDDEALANLTKVDHIVVLMLENRSFDHMLGYLSLSGGRSDVDGLTGSESETYEGRGYPIHRLLDTQGHSELEDPCHSPGCVDEQVAGGFVSSYAKYIARWEAKNGAPIVPADPGFVMGHYDARDLPVYDHLASEFCVCDRWFSSVAGATWPNRLYALTGGAEGSRDDTQVPLYNRASFVRFLDKVNVDWRWYSYDPAVLRLVDADYRLDTRHHHRFSFFDTRKLSTIEHDLGEALREQSSFLEDAANGQLPAVSWVDPHFKDPGVFGPDSNDDHPPSDLLAGQALVLDLYHALRSSPCWEKTMLVITYDEHGGFFDHVKPPVAADDDARFRQYGVRVPAIVVSPHVGRASVAHDTIFDHTSIIKTILARFCQADGTIPDMGRRVNAANHLGGLLTEPLPRHDIAPYADAIQRVASWRGALSTSRYAPQLAPPSEPGPLTDLQQRYATAARILRAAGLPAGHP